MQSFCTQLPKRNEISDLTKLNEAMAALSLLANANANFSQHLFTLATAALYSPELFQQSTLNTFIKIITYDNVASFFYVSATKASH